MILEAVGAGMIGYSAYGIWNRYIDKKNKICGSYELESLSGDGIKCSKHVHLSIKQSNEHLLMICPSGGGKSRRFFMPNIKTLKNCSIVCTDPSGEIEKSCKINKKIYKLNPFSNDTIGYNPLLCCQSEFEVRKIANVILTNGLNAFGGKDKGDQQSWVGMATPLLTSYMLMNYHTKQYTFDEMIKRICTMHIVPVVIEKDEKGNPTKIYRSIEQEIYESKVESAIIEFQAFKQVMGAMQTLSSIRTVMNTCLQLFFDNNLKKVFTKPSINISKLRSEESIVYIQVPERHSNYFSPLVATFLTQMFDILLDNPNGLQVYCLFDEFSTCGIIPNMKELLSTCRKFHISLNCAVQSLQQLYVLYGEMEGKAINELFKTLIVCGGLKDSAEYISKILGTKECKERNTTQTKPLMTTDEIRRMGSDKVLIICNNKRPVIDNMMELVD